MRMYVTNALRLFLITGFAIAPLESSSAQPKDNQPVQFSFPTAVPDTDFGRDALLKHIKGKRLEARDVASALFDNVPLFESADLLRRRIRSNELAALDKELDKVELVKLVKASKNPFEMAKKLDEAGISDGDVRRGVNDVFKEFYAHEIAAYWVRGFDEGVSEDYLLTRLKNPKKAEHAFEQIDTWSERDLESPAGIWRDLYAGMKYQEVIEYYGGLGGAWESTFVAQLYKDKDQTLTPEYQRVFAFGDSALIQRRLTHSRISLRDFVDRVQDRYREFEDSARASSVGRIFRDRALARVRASQEWLRTRGGDIKNVYEGRLGVRGSLPDLATFALNADGKETWDELPDYGLSPAITNFFKATPNVRLVRYSNDSIRAEHAGTRYEGKYDAKAGTLTLTPVYGRGKTIVLTGISFVARDLFLKAKIGDKKEGADNVLLRRAPSY